MKKSFIRDIVYDIIKNNEEYRRADIPKEYIEIAVDVISKHNDVRLDDIKNVVKSLSSINYYQMQQGA